MGRKRNKKNKKGRNNRRERRAPAAAASPAPAPAISAYESFLRDFRTSCQLDVVTSTLQARKTLVTIVEAFIMKGNGGAIVCNASGDRFLAFDAMDLGHSHAGTPFVEVQYICTTERPRADDFLHDQKVLVLSCSDEVTRTIDRHVLKHVPTHGMFDLRSGCQTFEGWLPPLRPVAAKDCWYCHVRKSFNGPPCKDHPSECVTCSRCGGRK